MKIKPKNDKDYDLTEEDMEDFDLKFIAVGKFKNE